MKRQTEYDLLSRIFRASDKVPDVLFELTDHAEGGWGAWIDCDTRVFDTGEDFDFRSFAFELMRQIEETGRAHFWRTLWSHATEVEWRGWLTDAGAKDAKSPTEHLAMLDCIAKTLEALPEAQ